MTAASSTEPQDRRARDARIRELDHQGWSLERIAEEVGITKQRVHQILGRPNPMAQLGELEVKLQAELDELLRHSEANRRRIRTLRRTLDRMAEEREAARIDQLLGLS